MATTLQRKRQNRDAQRRRRERLAADRQQAKGDVAAAPNAGNGPGQPECRVATAALPISPAHLVRAGRIAGQLEMALRYGLTVPDEDGSRAWLDAHPLGASFVLELLSVGGLTADFTRWRAAR